MNDRIGIAGAGISGLTAAINLARNGFDVTVFEKAGDVGSRFSGEFQGLENWTSERDILDALKELGVEINFYHRVLEDVCFYSPSSNAVSFSSDKAGFRPKRPLFYLIKRGGKDSVDDGLKRQALDAGVNIRFNSPANEKDCNIIATGPKGSTAIVSGITFETDMNDLARVIFNNSIAPNGYAYLLVADNRATLAAVIFGDFTNAGLYLDMAVREFRKIADFNTGDIKKFGGYGNFLIRNSARRNGKLLVGEAAGFQDRLAGYGMKYAFLSGYLAAKSIAEGEDYDALWKNSFSGEMRATFTSRFLLGNLGDRGHEVLVKGMQKRGISEELKRRYTHSKRAGLIYPLVRLMC